MGLIILLTAISIIIAFSAGIIVAVGNSSDNDNNVFAFVVGIVFLIVSIGLSVGLTYEYVENKEYSSTKYNLKKKVITIEEDNTVKLDTIYTFTHKQKQL